MWLKLLSAIVATTAIVLHLSTKDPVPPLTSTLNASYDYIIVGGGSAGCVLANRLSEDPDVTVLLIEAGGDDRGRDDISTPAFYGRMHHTDVDWDYISVPLKHGFDDHVGKRVYVPRGRVLGGTSSTNYLCYVRGHPRDFDSWVEQGCDGWSYEDVLPYFFKLEGLMTSNSGNSELLGRDGPVKIQNSNTLKLNEFLIKAASELGYSLFDYMSGEGEGLTPLYITAHGGERYSSSRAYLHPVLTRTNLHVVVDSYVIRVIFEGSRAAGVEMIRRSKKEKVLAKREVILSAGSYGTPKILMLSGIGPSQHLKQLGIPVLMDLPVGENLHEHVLYTYRVALQESVGLQITDFSSIWNKVQFHLFGAGPLSRTEYEYQLIVSTNSNSKEQGWPDVQILFTPALWSTNIFHTLGLGEEALKEAAGKDDENGITCIAGSMRPRSRGTFRLQSKDPFDDPLIDLNYFQDPEDVDTVRRGIDVCRRLIQTPSLQSLGARPADGPSAACVGPNSPYDSEAYWTCMVRRRSVSYHHPVGTAKMGSANDSTAVVDTTLRVRGISGLRVVDASVIPSVLSANINAAVMMIAEKASDIIRANRKSATRFQYRRHSLVSAWLVLSSRCFWKSRRQCLCRQCSVNMWLKLLSAIVATTAIVLHLSTKDPVPPLTSTLNASYDYIIVGGGSAGCVLANRLSEDPDITVLLLEAGGDDRGREDIATPAFVGFLQHSDIDWDYLTVPQKHGFEGHVDKRAYVPRGRVLGGSSSMNFMSYVRGHPRDFDSWAEQGCDGWSYRDVLPYFLKSEGFIKSHSAESEFLGKDGPLKIEEAMHLKLTDILTQAAEHLRFPLFDYVSDEGEGLSPMYFTTHRGQRSSTSRTYLHPVLNRSNLHVMVNAYVTRVVLEETKAVGVELVHRSRKKRVLAKKEVILSAGSIGSPKILMLSGIGPSQHLRDLKIPITMDLPVGDNLQDHLLYDYHVGLQAHVGLHVTDFSDVWNRIKFHLFGTGPLSFSGTVTHLFVSSTNHSKQLLWPDIQILFHSILWDSNRLRALGLNEEAIEESSKRKQFQYGFSCLPAHLRPGSKGTLRLQSSDPFDDPLIDFNYFQDPEDVTALVKGIDVCKRLVQTPSLQSLGAQAADGPSAACVGPNSPYDSEAYWRCMVRRRSVSYYHPVGTAKMGSANDSTAVVDTSLKVRGISGLSVVDASVIPSLPSANTNAAVIMIAEKASDIIRANRKYATKQ